ncbi:ABC transporter permease [Devosia elaeis]|uniref:ABC transporter n=1 Tax=Devosia elaeis TaxID=1770058 RepID=A0A178I6D0_9HYPH|nr:ABC transporter [Devosia elaeis]OAM81239.1 ABC transporter [Devosia elaeis]
MNFWRWLRPYLSLLIRFFHISFIEAQSEHQSTKLGILWIPLSTLIFTALLALVFKHSDAVPVGDFFVYVLSGYILWLFIQDSISGSTTVIQSRLDFAIHNNISMLGLFLKVLVDRLFELGINTVLLVVALALFSPHSFGPNLLLALVLLPLISLTSISLAYLVNLVTIMFPDMGAVIRTGVRFVFFASPVFWVYDGVTGVRHLLATYNPVSYYLAINRQVFGVEPVMLRTWLTAMVISAALVAISALTFARTKSIVTNIK